jgi:hypothetical protein
MTMPRLFASYSRSDAERVYAFIGGLRSQGIDVWIDVDGLKPGMNWAAAIQSALLSASGLLIFVSPASMESRFVVAELEVAAVSHDKLIIPVILEHVPDLPVSLQTRQWIDVSQATLPTEVGEAAQRAAPDILAAISHARSGPQLTWDQSAREAADIAAELKARPAEPDPQAPPPQSVFVIHGHDDSLVADVCDFLKADGIKPIVLKEIGGPELSLWQKFTRWSKETRYAIALLSPDDLGAARKEYDATYEGKRVGSDALQCWRPGTWCRSRGRALHGGRPEGRP